jgi:hypothetical protein
MEDYLYQYKENYEEEESMVQDYLKLVIVACIDESLILDLNTQTDMHEWMSEVRPARTRTVASSLHHQMMNLSATNFDSIIKYCEKMKDLYNRIMGCKSGRKLINKNNFLRLILNGAEAIEDFRYSVNKLYDRMDDEDDHVGYEDVKAELEQQQIRIFTNYNPGQHARVAAKESASIQALEARIKSLEAQLTNSRNDQANKNVSDKKNKKKNNRGGAPVCSTSATA